MNQTITCQKCGGEQNVQTYEDSQGRQAELCDDCRDAVDGESYTVTLVQPKTGDDFDVEVTAESPREAMRKAIDETREDGVQVARSWVREHLEVDF